MEVVRKKARIIKGEPKAIYSQWKDSFYGQLIFFLFYLFFFLFVNLLVHFFLSLFISFSLCLFASTKAYRIIKQRTYPSWCTTFAHNQKVLRDDLHIYLFISASHNE
jgi:hypothetical protein